MEVTEFLAAMILYDKIHLSKTYGDEPSFSGISLKCIKAIKDKAFLMVSGKCKMIYLNLKKTWKIIRLFLPVPLVSLSGEGNLVDIINFDVDC
jgi:hypothetical protein